MSAHVTGVTAVQVCLRGLLLLPLLAVAAGCGKKGPPLAPLVTLPVAPPEVSARRAGEIVVVRFTVPTANVSGVTPANLARVDVYAWTGEALTAEQVFGHAALVASVPVRRPQPSADEGAMMPASAPPPTPEPGLDQGAVAEVVETLEPRTLEPIQTPNGRAPEPPEIDLALAPPDLGPPLDELPPRRYVVVGVNRRGRRGPPTNAVAVPLWAAPAAPAQLEATVTEQAVTLEWKAPAGMRKSIQPPTLAKPPAATASAGAVRPAAPGPTSSPANGPTPRREPPSQEAAPAADVPSAMPDEPLPEEPAESPVKAGEAAAAADARLPSRVTFPWPTGSTGYHVYEVLPDGAEPSGVPPPPAEQPYPRRLTKSPLATTTFTDPRVEFGVERCYLVRTVETVESLSAESVPSAPVCVKAADVFAPSAPRSLGAVASPGAISLIWEANTEPDLAGYIVLRAVAPGAPVEPITPAPIRETTYRDTAVTPGTRYVYVVVAVDTADPPNASPPSNAVEETAR